MNKLSWSEIQSLFPAESSTHNEKFKEIFARLGKQELTAKDIDLVLNAPRKAEYTRMILDSLGQVIGRIETDDFGNGRCYNQIGNYLGSTLGGQTFNAIGEVVAQSDILSSLLFIEERHTAGNEPEYYPISLDALRKATQTDPFTGVGLDRKLTDQELARAIRLDAEAELDAINLYTSHMEATDSDEAKKVLEHVIKEEKDHLALFNDLIFKLDPSQPKEPPKDYLKEGSKRIAKVVKRKDGWHVLSKKGKNLGGPYKTKAEAVKRLRQVEYFKHKGEIFLDKKIEATSPNRETQQSYSLDSILGCDEDDKSKRPISLEDLLPKHTKDSILKVSLDTEWLRDLWVRESKKVMEELAQKDPEFAEEYSTGHVPLHEEYSMHDLKRVTVPYMEGSIDKDQAEKLLRDLMYQFRSKLYLDHGLSQAEATEDKGKEKESSQEDLPAYGTADIFPYSGTGAGMPSSGDLSRIVNDTPSRNIQVK